MPCIHVYFFSSHGHSHIKDPMTQARRCGKAFPIGVKFKVMKPSFSPSVNVDSVCKS